MQSKLDFYNQLDQVDKPIVSIVGLGFVGVAMTAAVSLARTNTGEHRYFVLGIDRDDEVGLSKIKAINRGISPIISVDHSIQSAIHDAYIDNSVLATADLNLIASSEIVVVDVNLDISLADMSDPTSIKFDDYSFKELLIKIAENIQEECLVIIETTIPVGYTEHFIKPLFTNIFRDRSLDPNLIRLAHSYERVMPGENYLRSITSYYRVYSAINEEAKRMTRDFLSSFIDTESYPLTELKTTNDSEMAKLIENSYRATNIAFIQEWSELAGRAGVDLYEVLNSVRKRETHKNIMNPGFGVGGYCLTKDAILAEWGSREFFENHVTLACSMKAITINETMPDYSFRLMLEHSKHIASKKVGILGVSYRPAVSDTRQSPARRFIDSCISSSIEVFLHDFLVTQWSEVNQPIVSRYTELSKDINILLFSLGDERYKSISPMELKRTFPKLLLIIDASDAVNDEKAAEYRHLGIKTVGIGKGHWGC
ncbi:MAG: hypothetical protein CL398_01870 [Acidiferrobacteraceae bacterium]|nr:hypothetical protein [Acidiferrobacteraceae bacterium]|tara:strand:- start:1113 stop:2561 length:1449 start_codon:yes stop_codon:yes gene_type:complete